MTIVDRNRFPTRPANGGWPNQTHFPLNYKAYEDVKGTNRSSLITLNFDLETFVHGHFEV